MVAPRCLLLEGYVRKIVAGAVPSTSCHQKGLDFREVKLNELVSIDTPVGVERNLNGPFSVSVMIHQFIQQTCQVQEYDAQRNRHTPAFVESQGIERLNCCEHKHLCN